MSNSDSKRFYVYAHYKADTGELFYVGKGCGKRAWKSANRNVFWHRTVAKHGLSISIVFEADDEDDAYTHERFLVLSARAYGVKLVNLNDGGRSGSPTAYVRKKMSDLNKGRPSPMKGKNHTEETKRLLSKRRLEQVNVPKPSIESRLRMSVAYRGDGNPFHGKTHTPEMRAKWSKERVSGNHPRAAPVVCIDNGMTFPCIQDAARWVVSSGVAKKARSSDIHAVCHGNQHTAYGLRWAKAMKK
jgi:hypothetical protein